MGKLFSFTADRRIIPRDGGMVKQSGEKKRQELFWLGIMGALSDEIGIRE
jgi:hypothetical protein